MKEKKKRNIYAVLIALFVITVAGLYSYLYLIPEITGALTPTVTAWAPSDALLLLVSCVFAAGML